MAASVTLDVISRLPDCGDFGFLVRLIVQRKESDDISSGHLVAKRTQLQVDVHNGVSFFLIVNQWEFGSQA